MCYMITLDSHEYFGPFPSLIDAHNWGTSTYRTSYQLVAELPNYAKDQVQVPKFLATVIAWHRAI